MRLLIMSQERDNKIVTYATVPNQKDLLFIKELLEDGKVVPVIDRRYPLSEVPEAIRYLEEGHARGKVVITLEHNNKQKGVENGFKQKGT